MMRFKARSVRWLLEATLAVAVTACAAPGDEPCRVDFEGKLATATGKAPLQASGIAFCPGKTGQAAIFAQDACLDYPTAGNYSGKQGTVEMWVKRLWDDTDTPTDRILWLIQPDEGKNNLVYLGFRGTGRQGRVYFANAAGVDGAVVPLDWEKDAWHHLLVCWDDQLRYRALYIDGEFKTAAHYTRPMPVTAPQFHVGYSPNTGRGAVAALDRFAIHQTVTPSDFLEKTGNTAAARKAKAELAVTVKRLRETYSFDRVAKDHIEVGWQDLQGIPTPFTQRVPVQTYHHPAVVMVHPDLSITLGRQNDSLVLGFALGEEAALPDMYRVTRRLRRGYLPIVESRWQRGSLAIEQTAFCILPDDERVVSGTETQLLIVRMKVTNTADHSVESALLTMVGKALGTQRTNYRPFVPSPKRWQQETRTWKLDKQSLTADDHVLMRYRGDGPQTADFHPVFEPTPGGVTQDKRPTGLRNCLRMPLQLQPGESRTLDFVIAGTSQLQPMAELEWMAAVRYEHALQRAEAHGECLLEHGMKLTTPDQRINSVYKAMILSSLQNLHKSPHRPWHEPDQSCFHHNGVWPWEFSQQAVPLASVGYHKELEPSLRFFTERQAGVGPHAVDYGPTGDLDSIEGCYIGNCNLYWMCETGAVLHAMAAKYLYSCDDVWLKENRPSILAAWQFIQRARDQMRTEAADGKRPINYGLLPPGRATDGNDYKHMVGFSDNYTWEGMHHMAGAFSAAGLPEGKAMTRDAEEYRQCILDAVRRSQFTEPETGLVLIPNALSGDTRAHGGKVLGNRYSMAMWQTGLLDANDPRFDDAFEWQQRQGGFLMGLCFPMLPVDSPFWYVNSIEKGKYMNHLARGEFEKALLIFHSNLLYSMSGDCYQTVERINLDEPNYSPFQQNSSGNGRIIEMCRRMVIDEQEPGVLWLLRGCPRRWFAPGESIVVEDAQTLYGPMSLRTRSEGAKITVDLDSPSRATVPPIRLVVRHPERRRLIAATIDGRACPIEGETIRIAAPRGRFSVTCIFSK